MARLHKFYTTIYNAIVNSQLTYAIPVWGGNYSLDSLNQLFILQKKALRNLFSIKKVSRFIKGHTKEVFGKYNILTVYNIYGYMTILHLAKLILLNEPLFLCELLQINKNGSKRNNRIYLPPLSLKHYKNNFCYQGLKSQNYGILYVPHLHIVKISLQLHH